MPCHHALAEALHAYIDAAGIADDRKGWLFRTARGHKGSALSEKPMGQPDAWRAGTPSMLHNIWSSCDAGLLSRLRTRTNCVDSHRVADTLELLLPAVLVCDPGRCPGQRSYHVRNEDFSGQGSGADPCGDVDRSSEDIVRLADDITRVNAHV